MSYLHKQKTSRLFVFLSAIHKSFTRFVLPRSRKDTKKKTLCLWVFVASIDKSFQRFLLRALACGRRFDDHALTPSILHFQPRSQGTFSWSSIRFSTQSVLV